MKLILQETEASILVTDMIGFRALAERLGPLELGIALSGYYDHIGSLVERHGGEIVKFFGDGVLAAFLGGRHRDRALSAIAELAATRDGWVADNAKVDLPPMDYSAGLASGPVLAGEMGTDRIHFWDVIGAPVNNAFSLCTLAAARKLHHLIDGGDPGSEAVFAARPDGPDVIEVEAAELAGKLHRLLRIAP